MQPLDPYFEVGDFSYAQAFRLGDLAIYARTHTVTGLVRYEVIVITKRPAQAWPGGRTTPAHEVYPGVRDWGAYGWTFSTLPAAYAWLQRLARMRPDAMPVAV